MPGDPADPPSGRTPDRRGGRDDRGKPEGEVRHPRRRPGLGGQHAGAERGLLASSYEKALAIAAERNLASVAFPAISTGIYGFPRAEASRVASLAVAGFLARSDFPREVRLVFFSEEDATIFLEHHEFGTEGGG